LDRPVAESDNHEGKTSSPHTCCSKAEPQAANARYNSNVSNVLPVTTLRTIDLEGKKNSSLLFSRFCEEVRVFFEGKGAPQLGQIAFAGHKFVSGFGG
jgi:hypothetical protein